MATYYTATTGSDGRTCAQAQSESTPFLTVGKGASCLKPGDTLVVAGGNYNERLINTIPSGTSWTAPVRISSPAGAWIKPTSGDICLLLNQQQKYIEFDGLNFNADALTNGVVKIEAWGTANNPHHIRIKNAEIIGNKNASAIAVIFTASVKNMVGGNELIKCRVHGGGLYDRDHGLYIQSSDNLVDGCEFWDLAGAGIQSYNGYGFAFTNLTIKNTLVRNLRTGIKGDDGKPGRHWAFVIYSVTGALLENVVARDIPSNGGGTSGIEIYSAANVTVRHATITRVAGYGITANGSGHALENSIVFGNNVDVSGSLTQKSNLIGVDPKFVSVTDCHLTATSPAINKATGTSPATDIEGTARPQGSASDIGAYEFTANTPVPPEPPVPVPPTPVTLTTPTNVQMVQ